MSARTIFLSHTSLMAHVPEGRSFVQAAKDAALRAGLSASDMQFFSADDRPPAAVCQDAVRACGIYVGLFGHDYGSRVRERPEVSYTELEFLTALEERQNRGLRLFVFLLSDKVGKDLPDADQVAFRSRVLNDYDLTAKFFEDANSLELEVYHTRARGGDGSAANLMVRGRGVATLLTTRFREAVPAGVCVREVEALLPDEATALLRTHVGEAVEADPTSAGVVLERCGRLPLFVNVAGRAAANGYYSLAEYADELGQRGLLALADEDERAAVVFDLSWRHLSALAQEVFAALALAPGEDIGPNLLVAWLKQSGTAEGSRPRPGRLLGELANASLLIPTDEQARRYRYHDRVRDYALGKLALPREEVRRRLLGCYADWDMVRAEFGAVGAFALSGQYHRLRGWNAKEPKDFAPWYHFVRGQAPVLGSHPELFFQQCLNEPVDSAVSRAAQERVGMAEAPMQWLEWVNRPQEFVAPACVQVLTGHTDGVTSVAVSADGRTAVSGAWDHTVRVWDLSSGQCRAILTGHTGWVRSVAVSANGRTTVSGGNDSTVRVWDLSSGQCRAILTGHTGTVWSVALSADGRTAVSGAVDQTVRVWDLSSGQCRATHPQGSPEAHHAWESVRTAGAFTARRSALFLEVAATGTEDVLLRFPGQFRCADCLADGRHVVAGDDGGQVYFFRLRSRDN
jgi:hypothetical protein